MRKKTPKKTVQSNNEIIDFESSKGFGKTSEYLVKLARMGYKPAIKGVILHTILSLREPPDDNNTIKIELDKDFAGYVSKILRTIIKDNDKYHSLLKIARKNSEINRFFCSNLSTYEVIRAYCLAREINNGNKLLSKLLKKHGKTDYEERVRYITGLILSGGIFNERWELLPDAHRQLEKGLIALNDNCSTGTIQKIYNKHKNLIDIVISKINHTF